MIDIIAAVIGTCAILRIAYLIGRAAGEIRARDRLERAVCNRTPIIHYNEETDQIWVETAVGREHF